MDRGPTESQIRQAKTKAVGGGRKRCTRGKSCSATCISGDKYCLVDLPSILSSGIAKVKDFVRRRGIERKVETRDQGLRDIENRGVNRFRDLIKRINQKLDPQGRVIPTRFRKVPTEVNAVSRTRPSAPMTINEKVEPKRNERAKLRAAKSKISAILDEFKTSGRENQTTLRGSVEPDKVRWAATEGSGAKIKGEGVFGAFVTLPAKKLLGFSDGMPPEVGVKVGRVGQSEAVILKRLGDAGIGPRLIASKFINRPVSNADNGTIHRGAIAMEVVPGVPFYKARDTINGKNSKDTYWDARAKLHKLGIAHNDAHGGNFIIDDQGNGRFVDLGLAQRSWKAALAEALGGHTGADFQAASTPRRGQMSILDRNYGRVKQILSDEGFSKSEIRQIVEFGIQRSASEYRNSAFSKIPIPLARRLINVFYEDIG